MTFSSVRIITFILIIVLTVGISKKNKIKLSKATIIILLIIGYGIVYIIPFEKYFVKLTTVEKAVHYYYPNNFTRYKYIQNDCAFLYISDKNNSEQFIGLVNRNNNWTFDIPLNQGQGNLKRLDNYYIFINTISEKNTTAIVVTPRYTKTNIDISDSLNTSFTKMINDSDNWVSNGYIGIIEQTLDGDYRLVLDGKEYKIIG